MLKQTALLTALVFALAGAPVGSAFGAQGKHGQGNPKSHVIKDKGDKGPQGRGNGHAKVKVDKNKTDGRDWNWTAEQRARYGPWLPAGMTLEQASAGFGNQGQFIAAINASREHNVSFLQLKDLMVTRGMSLGEALRTLGR